MTDTKEGTQLSGTEEARRLLAAITPGPWEIYRYHTGGGRIFVNGIGDHYKGRRLVADMEPERAPGDVDDGAVVYHEGDREFLFAAPALVADLADTMEAVAKLHQVNGTGRWCTECELAWPCQTARILSPLPGDHEDAKTRRREEMDEELGGL